MTTPQPILRNFDLMFRSTTQERYDTDMNRRVEALLAEQNVEVIEIYGGTVLGIAKYADLPSENGYVITATTDHAHAIANMIEVIVSHPVTVRAENE